MRRTGSTTGSVEVVEKEGIEFTLTRGSPPSISTFEEALEEIKSMCEAQFGHLVAEEVVEKDGIEFSVIRGLPPLLSWRWYVTFGAHMLPLLSYVEASSNFVESLEQLMVRQLMPGQHRPQTL